MPGDRDLFRIATEGRDIALHPLQGGDLVEQAEIHRALWPRHRRMREETQRAHPVVDRHHDDAFARERRTVVHRHAAGTEDQRAAMDPDQNRAIARAFLQWRPDIEVEAVFGDAARIAAVGDGQLRILDAGIAEAVRAARAFPRHDRLWRPPAQTTDRWGGVGDAAEHRDAVFAATFQHARIGLGQRDDIGPGGQGGEQQNAGQQATHARLPRRGSSQHRLMPGVGARLIA